MISGTQQRAVCDFVVATGPIGPDGTAIFIALSDAWRVAEGSVTGPLRIKASQSAHNVEKEHVASAVMHA